MTFEMKHQEVKRNYDRITCRRPCGSDEWVVLRTGADIRLRCAGCGHLLMLPRAKAEAMIRRIDSPVQ
mgnify:CR=1 FL=1